MIPHAFGEKAITKLPFELEQIRTLREHLRNEFEQRHAPAPRERIPLANSRQGSD